jgi:23S rRNA pseudouridine2604 synthase
VTVNKPITNDFIEKIRNGLPILDQITKKCYAEQIHKKQFRIILTQGLNRQIRRMCDYLEYKVVKLKRIRIMNIKLNTKVGRYRDLNKKEMNELLNLISDSEKNFN